MLYFAYGSNLDPDQMRRLCPAHQVVGLAALRDHRMSFPQYSPDWSGGVASPESHHGETLWGMLFELTEADLKSLDEFEGFRAAGDQHNIFERAQVTVELVRPDDGSIPRKVRASIYRAHPSNPSPPSPRYRDTLVKGARHFRLPEEYVAKLLALPVGSETA